MKMRNLLIVVFFIFAGSIHAQQDLKLWYNQPAINWETEALPIGNGRLGAMIFGGVPHEHIQFNEGSLWLGDEEKTGAYQAFGDIFIDLDHSNFTNYKRELDINRAVHSVSYESKGVKYFRECFASAPDNVIVYKFTADKPGMLNGTVMLTDMHNAKIEATGNKIIATGTLKESVFTLYDNDKNYSVFLDYESQLLVLNDGGKIETIDGKIVFKKANSITLILAAGTNFIQDRSKGWKGELPHKAITSRINSASKISYNKLLQKHVDDYQNLFQRVQLNLGENSTLPTDERLKNANISKSRDISLEALIFQYGRYLLIASSRDGLPANLQGKWNNTNNPNWRCDYHTDINVQMNYWPAQQTNISECFMPFANWLYSIRDVRKEDTYKNFKTRGWTMRPENGIFGGSTWQWIESGSAWCMQNVWDQYAFNQDKKYLKDIAYPMMKEVCEFWLDWLKPLPNGYLVAPNGFSPEHGPREDGVSHDQQLIWDLFDNTIKACDALGIDKSFRDTLALKQKKLLGPQIGKWGQLQEWMVDRDDPKDNHLHLPHLVALHPGHQITVDQTPEFAEAAKVSIIARGDTSVGWSMAWKICFWARLKDSEYAHKIMKIIVKKVYDKSVRYSDGSGGFYENLFNAGPPFQIDGNFGFTAGVSEMLIQSHAGYIELLPAIPNEWKDGSFKGLCVRGGAEINAVWKNNQLCEMEMTAKANNVFKIKIPDYFKKFKLTINGKEKMLAVTNGFLELKLKNKDKVKFTPK
jgi:alpha-L-fucosidase 2